MTPSACAGCMSPCLLHLASIRSTHAVVFPGSQHRYAFAPTPTPSYVSTLSLSTPPGMLPMVRSMSFVANIGRESQVREGEEAQSRERAVPILPVLRPLRIDDADDNAVSYTRAAATARFRRRAEGEGEDVEDQDAWVDEDDDDDEEEMGR
ncbi:hypothetical protein B0H14DRAFT_2856841 [Mycena olivaceomarginata]|nr:hypothetical protein B0H14DRAFT_2856841 [Mycena olivaceomarginata]